MTETARRVSIVVPVYNPGPYLEPGVASILAQTMPLGQTEAIFVDDGSTDGTAARLDRLAADHSDSVVVIHIPPSGAPGRPRNIGMAAARGEYVQFLDADDELAPDALQRLVEMADRNRSDIVVGKFASASIPRSQRLFERSVERTRLAHHPQLVDSSLGPTKLFRRAFLAANRITFPEGWRSMEDQYFTLHAYFRADVVSILADRACYYFHRRADDAHLTFEAIEPEPHVANLRAILDMVEAETAPGPIRRRVFRRLLAVEVVRKVSEPTYQDLADADRIRLFDAARDLVRERFDGVVVDGLPALARLRCGLLRDDRPDELLEVARHAATIEGSAHLETIEWWAGYLDIDLTAGLEFADVGRPVTVYESGQRTLLDPTTLGLARDRAIDVTAEIADVRVEVVFRSRSSALEWLVDARTHDRERHSPAGESRTGTNGDQRSVPIQTDAHARIDLLRVGAGTTALGSGTWDVLARLSAVGIQRTASMGASDPAKGAAACPPILLGDPPTIIVPTIDPTGLRLEVDPPPSVVAAALAGRPVRVLRDGDHLILELGMTSGRSTRTLPVHIAFGPPGSESLIAARLRPRNGTVVLEATLVGFIHTRPGSYPLALRLGDSPGHADVALCIARVEGQGRIRVADLPRLTLIDRVGASARWPLTSLASAARSRRSALAATARRRVRAVAWRLPGGGQDRMRSIARRFR